jgi:hypothetical protein
MNGELTGLLLQFSGILMREAFEDDCYNTDSDNKKVFIFEANSVMWKPCFPTMKRKI